MPLAAKFSIGQNVSPAPLLIFVTGSLAVELRYHHITYTFSPSAAISASTDSEAVVLRRLILFPKLRPQSFDARSITSLLPVLLDHYVT